MKTIYITGDRSLDPLTAALNAGAMLNMIAEQQGTDISVITGDAPTGVENAVRYLFGASEKLTVVSRKVTDDKPDHDEFHNRLKASVDEVYILHGAPLDSSITKSAMRVFDPDKVHLPVQGM